MKTTICWILGLFFALTSFCVCGDGKQYTLNVPRVLLPFVPTAGTKSNFTLASEHGCFSWVSTKPDVASVQPVFDSKSAAKCSREAVITPQSTSSTRSSSVIVAKELVSGQVLRCDVFVDAVVRIEITTRTRELLLEEEPERFELRAFDNEGNMFSTIRGHVVEWTLLRDEDAAQQQLDPDTILNFVPFSDSLYTTDPTIAALEEQNLQGDTVLVAGVNTGTAKVQAKLVDKAWKEVKADVVKLLVMENIMLQPAADAYIMVFSFLDYHVERKKYGKIEVVPMPSDQYRLELTNVTVGRLDHQRSRVTGLLVGDTEVVLQDRNMLHMPATSRPSASIHVTSPHHIGFSISPIGLWVLESGRNYAITVNLYDKLNHKILVTENVIFDSTLPSEYLQTLYASPNGSYFHVRALKAGTTQILSTLVKIKDMETGDFHVIHPVVSKQQTVEIYDPIQVVPKRMVILWDPATEFHYQYTMKATGGSGSYRWSCDPESVVGISYQGTLTALAPGMTTITAADSKNAAHSDSGKAYVVPPAEIAFLPTKVEAVVGTALVLPLHVKGYTDEGERTLLPFADCRKLPLEVTSLDTSVFNLSINSAADLSSLPSGACVSLQAVATKAGNSKVTVTYKYKDITLSASVTIAAYNPLVSVDPESIAVLTLGSSKNFIFEGGPAPWVLDRSRYYEELSLERKSDVAVYGPQQHVYRLVCKELGEQTVTLVVGNGPTTKNVFPANDSATVRVSCALPVTMVMRPLVQQMADCPLLERSSHATQFPVRNGRALELEIVVFDGENRPFDNFTSLHWEWTASDSSLLSLPRDPAVKLNAAKKSAVTTVQLSSQSGTVSLTVSCKKHIASYLEAEHITFKDPFRPGVNSSLSLFLRGEAEIVPNIVMVFYHPQTKVTLQIEHGSGHFQLAYPSKPHSPVAELDYVAESQQIIVSPLAEGHIKLVLRDLCLEMSKEVSANIYIAGISSIQVQVADKVQVGSHILAFVKVVDGRGVPFPPSQHKYMNLLSYSKASYIDVRPASVLVLASLSTEQVANSAVFVVEGVDVGSAHLTFNATLASGKIISSWPAEIQVFAPLKMNPKYITLLPTATFQILSTGGPLPQANIAYSIGNATVASVDGSGLIEALVPGNTTVTGKAQAMDPTSGHVTTYSEDVVYVQVLKLKGIKIFMPFTRLLAGMEVALYAHGIDEEPFSFASASPLGISFLWSASNIDVLSLVSVYEKAGISIQEEQDFAAIMHTRNPGQGVIRLTAKCPPGLCAPDQAVFSDQVQVQVLPALQLLNPPDGLFLLPHNGIARIVTNRDGTSHMSYKLLNDGEESRSVVTLSPQGEVHSSVVNGHAVVMVTALEVELGMNQTVIVHVEVRPVASLSVVPLSVAQAAPNSKFHAFPLGYTAEFAAHLHDNIGRQFDFADISLGQRLNRYDIVQVSPVAGNGSYVVKAAKQGDAILKIWVSAQPHISDFIRIRVGYAIMPSLATVHVGTKICFTTHLTEDQPGWWTTGDQGLLHIQPETGVAMALSTGRAVVYHKIKDIIDTHTEVTVARILEITFNFSRELSHFTNGPRQAELGPYLVPVQFSPTLSGGEFTPLLISPNRACSEEVNASNGAVYIQQVPFECLLELKNGGTVFSTERFIVTQPYFDAATGKSYCHLQAVEDVRSVETLATMQGLSLSLKVRAFDFAKTYSEVSRSLPIPFVPAFALNRYKLTLSSTENAADIQITGSTKQIYSLQAVSSDPISVQRVSVSDNMAVYRISIADHPHPQSTSNMRVTFSAGLTQQESVLPVSYVGTGTCDLPAMCPEKQQADKSIVPSSTPVSKLPLSSELLVEDNRTVITAVICAVVAILVVLIGYVALKEKSPHLTAGFQSQLPPFPLQASPPAFQPSPARTPVAASQTPFQKTPPVPGAVSSAFRRTKLSPSPQHGLFSQ